MCNQLYSAYLRDLVDNFRSNPKRYWSFLKCFTKKGSLHPVLRDGDSLVSEDIDRATLLNRVFATRFSDPNVSFYPPVTCHQLPAFQSIGVTCDHVCTILKSIPVSKP